MPETYDQRMQHVETDLHELRAMYEQCERDRLVLLGHIRTTQSDAAEVVESIEDAASWRFDVNDLDPSVRRALDLLEKIAKG